MKKVLIVTYVVLWLLMIIGTFVDFQLAELVFNHDDAFGLFMQQFIYIPTFFIAFVSVVFLLRMQSEGETKKNLNKVFLLVGLYLVLAGMFLGLFTYYKISIVILITLALTLFSSLIAYQLPKEDMGIYRHMAILYISVLVVGYALIFGLKLIWGRERFYLLEDASDFTLWFIPRGYFPGTRYNAFPSGHVTAAMMSVIIVFVVYYIDRFRKYLIPTIVVVSIYIMLSALSRMLLGKHYLTDTVGSMIIILTLFILIHFKVKKLDL